MNKREERIEEGNIWWQNYCATMNKIHAKENKGIAIGCAIYPSKPFGKRRYFEHK